MNDGFILVRRDYHFRDVGVFTGRMSLTESSYDLAGVPAIKGDPELSPHIEHAFIFPSPWQAWRWADRLLPDAAYKLQTIEFMSWDVRPFGELHVGEVRPWRTINRWDTQAGWDAQKEAREWH